MKKLLTLVAVSVFTASTVFAQTTPVPTPAPVPEKCVTCCQPKAEKVEPKKTTTPKAKPCTCSACTICPAQKLCPSCPKQEVKVEKETVFKKNTVSLLLGKGPDGVNSEVVNSNINLHRGYGLVVGARYERRFDENWSGSLEYLSSQSGNLGLGFSW